MAEFSKNGRKHCWQKGETALNEQFLLFPTGFSKDVYCRHVKTRACLEKGQVWSLKFKWRFGNTIIELR